MSEATLTTTPNYHLLNAMYSWISENNGRPFILVPLEHVPGNIHHLGKDGLIVLNVSMTATGGFTIDRELVSFSARFSGVNTRLDIPTDKILAIWNADMPSVMRMDLPQWEKVEPQEQPAPPKRPTLSVVK